MSVWVAEDTIADCGFGFGDGSPSRYGDLGVFGGLRGSSAVCDDPLTIRWLGNSMVKGRASETRFLLWFASISHSPRGGLSTSNDLSSLVTGGSGVDGLTGITLGDGGGEYWTAESV